MSRGKSKYLGAYNRISKVFKCLADDLLVRVGERADEALDSLRDKDVRRKVIDILALTVEDIRQQLIFTVDYSLSLVEMIEACKYDWYCTNINAVNFPLRFPKGQKKRSLELEGVLFDFGRHIGYGEAIRLMERDGYRPARIEELLAFGAKYPKLQSQFSILALGSVWEDHVACLRKFTDKKAIKLEWVENYWDRRWRFLAVRKPVTAAS